MATQPAKNRLRELFLTVPQVAEWMGIPPSHLRGVLNGTTAPSETVRRELPKVLGAPLDELFDADLLAREWTGTRPGNATRKAVQP